MRARLRTAYSGRADSLAVAVDIGSKLQLVALDLPVQCVPADAQRLGGTRPVAAERLQRGGDCVALNLSESAQSRGRSGLAASCSRQRQRGRFEDLSVRQRHGGLEAVLELAHVAGPGVGDEA